MTFLSKMEQLILETPRPVDDFLRDPLEARRQRDLAMTRVDDAADPLWKTAADWTVLYVCLTQRVFTGDDVWAAGLPKPREPRALGPVILRARKRGLCQKTGRIVASQVPKDHCNPHTEWESLIYGGNP